ncbi:GNAT family N-acetyltransferase [Nocardioides sp. TF02-7]|uniref:GNAT family N-acetyltransferase n=1 Tax=Nocardioides sp. TF02-7 TaxID=2917724 RepID=UPI001F06DA12|nr:GNAT family N-acetyltransferase [Nocardioides sp. TF02-7]UMG91891.1 GNAT family N-acetyltransferase [Nocardioides sp. TF02-7]
MSTPSEPPDSQPTDVGATSGADVLLSDGRIAVVRGLGPEDGEALHDLHDRVSDEALWLRFFSVARAAAHRYVDHVLTSPDTIALVAEVDGRVVALGTAEPVGPDVCEVAFLVADEMRGQGMGTLLLEHLAAAARDQGLRWMDARVLSSNHRMMRVFGDAGFDVEVRHEGGEQVLRMGTAVTADVQAAADRREFAAERLSLGPLLAPRTAAVYGVRRDGSGIGAAVVSAVRSGGFRGGLAIVHPNAERVLEVPAYPAATQVPHPVDLAIIAVPAERAADALEDAAAAGVRAAVVISSGFREMGRHGAALEHDLVVAARRHGIRLVGPNGLGLISNDPDVRLHATFGGTVPPPGGLAVASQSGGVGIALMDLVARAGVGVRYFVSLGNKADVSGNDLLAAWYDDAAVTCGALYLESFGNARKFARFARLFSERKPLVALVGGRSTGGQRAGASHTAAAASPAAGVRALFAQAGVIGCDDAEQLAETCLLLTREPLPAGRRVGIVSNAGGLGVLAADAAEDERLDVVELSPDLQERLAGLVNQTTGTANPVDAGAGAEAAQLAAISSEVLGSGEVDALVVVLVATGTNDVPATLEALARLRAERPRRPVAVVVLGAEPTAGSEVTVFGSAAAALGALGRAVRYAEWRATKTVGGPPPTDPVEVRHARATARRLLAEATPEGWVRPETAAELFGRYGIDLLGRFTVGVEGAAEVAAAVGFPVAVKLAEPDVVHKTELGAVRTGLQGAEEVRAAVAAFEQVRGWAEPGPRPADGRRCGAGPGGGPRPVARSARHDRGRRRRDRRVGRPRLPAASLRRGAGAAGVEHAAAGAAPRRLPRLGTGGRRGGRRAGEPPGPARGRRSRGGRGRPQPRAGEPRVLRGGRHQAAARAGGRRADGLAAPAAPTSVRRTARRARHPGMRTAPPGAGGAVRFGGSSAEDGVLPDQLGLGPGLAEAPGVAGQGQRQHDHDHGAHQVVVDDRVVLQRESGEPHHHVERGAGDRGGPHADPEDEGEADAGEADHEEPVGPGVARDAVEELTHRVVLGDAEGQEAEGGAAAVDPGVGAEVVDRAGLGALAGGVAEGEQLVEEGPQEGHAEADPQDGQRTPGGAVGDDVVLDHDVEVAGGLDRGHRSHLRSWGPRPLFSVDASSLAGGGPRRQGRWDRLRGS